MPRRDMTPIWTPAASPRTYTIDGLGIGRQEKAKTPSVPLTFCDTGLIREGLVTFPA
jgi:hypothetical protein